MNRGIARRTMFETGADMEALFERIGRECARGRLEVHAFAVLSTHYHLLVRSPRAALSSAMHDVQMSYSRYFNRSRRRDGPLVRQRFRSKHVDSFTYRSTLVRYLDANAPRAGVVSHAYDYPYGSCRAYVTGTGPSWLQRDWVEAQVCEQLALPQYDGARYPEVFVRGFTDAQARFVERRIAARHELPDPVDSVLRGAAPAVLDWMRRKAKLADGTKPGIAIVCDEAVEEVLASPGFRDRVNREWATQLGRRPVEAVHALLLRELAVRTWEEVGRVIGVSAQAAGRLARNGRRAFDRQPELAAIVADAAFRAVRRTFA